MRCAGRWSASMSPPDGAAGGHHQPRAAVGKAASHANQTTLYLTPLHGRADMLRKLIANIGAALQHVKAAAEQFKDLERWGCLLRYISDRSAPVIGQPKPAQGLPSTGLLPDLG
jgi:hypothetical protein